MFCAMSFFHFFFCRRFGVFVSRSLFVFLKWFCGFVVANVLFARCFFFAKCFFFCNGFCDFFFCNGFCVFLARSFVFLCK